MEKPSDENRRSKPFGDKPASHVEQGPHAKKLALTAPGGIAVLVGSGIYWVVTFSHRVPDADCFPPGIECIKKVAAVMKEVSDADRATSMGESWLLALLVTAFTFLVFYVHICRGEEERARTIAEREVEEKKRIAEEEGEAAPYVDSRSKGSQTATGPTEGDESDERSLLVPSIHALGRCYEVLQLQLYLRAGYPIYYAVPEAILKTEILRSCAAGKSTEECWEEMCTFLRDKVFRGKLPDAGNLQKQCVYVIDRTKPPACFINHDAGLLTFEGIDLDVGWRELPLPASYMLDERRERYRKRVLSFKPADDEAALRNLLNGAKNKELFKHIFHGAKDDDPDPAHGKDAANDAAKDTVTVR
ncbi:MULTISPECIES: hypothetical protein [Paraburkholderia]|uniref:hypothetical protein n=1 Tax=Paraburkholderia TaxID=1822464 RepID=UPI000371ED37|nr:MULTISPECIES: hypothetical protein [Paraburkholderia]MDH6152890.1 hypothetical protein [Paraburkholderia sp. WSM4179]